MSQPNQVKERLGILTGSTTNEADDQHHSGGIFTRPGKSLDMMESTPRPLPSPPHTQDSFQEQQTSTPAKALEAFRAGRRRLLQFTTCHQRGDSHSRSASPSTSDYSMRERTPSTNVPSGGGGGGISSAERIEPGSNNNHDDSKGTMSLGFNMHDSDRGQTWQRHCSVAPIPIPIPISRVEANSLSGSQQLLATSPMKKEPAPIILMETSGIKRKSLTTGPTDQKTCLEITPKRKR